VSKTHWAARRRQPSLLTASCCATFQVMPMLFKSCCVVSIQFFRGLPDFAFVPLIFQCTACLGSLLSSIRRMCPSHLTLLWWDLSSPVVSVPWPSHYCWLLNANVMCQLLVVGVPCSDCGLSLLFCLLVHVSVFLCKNCVFQTDNNLKFNFNCLSILLVSLTVNSAITSRFQELMIVIRRRG